MYLHEMGDGAASFTKEEMQLGYATTDTIIKIK